MYCDELPFFVVAPAQIKKNCHPDGASSAKSLKLTFLTCD